MPYTGREMVGHKNGTYLWYCSVEALDVQYDSKHYEFAITSHTVPGKAEPPDLDRWIFVQMSLSERTPAHVVVLWTRMRKL